MKDNRLQITDNRVQITDNRVQITKFFMKVACNFDNTNSILSSVVQENVAPLGLRSVGVVNK